MSEPQPPTPVLPSCITAPQLVGAEGSVASAEARAHGLHAVCHQFEVAPNSRSGQVLAQIPTAGSKLSTGEPIALLIATTFTGEPSVREPLAGDTHSPGDWSELEVAPEQPPALTWATTAEGARAARPVAPAALASPPRVEPLLRRKPRWNRSRWTATIGLAALAVVTAFGIALNPTSPSRGEQRGAAISADQPGTGEPQVPRRSMNLSRRPPNRRSTDPTARLVKPNGSHRRVVPSRRARRAQHAEHASHPQDSRHHGTRAASRPAQDRSQAPAAPSPPASQPPAPAGATPRAPSPAPLPPGPEFF